MPIQFQDESVSVSLPLPLALVRSISLCGTASFHLSPSRLPPPPSPPLQPYSCAVFYIIAAYCISHFNYSLSGDNSDAYIFYANKCIFSLIKRGRSLRNRRACNEVFQLHRVIDSSVISDMGLAHREMSTGMKLKYDTAYALFVVKTTEIRKEIIISHSNERYPSSRYVRSWITIRIM